MDYLISSGLGLVLHIFIGKVSPNNTRLEGIISGIWEGVALHQLSKERPASALPYVAYFASLWLRHTFNHGTSAALVHTVIWSAIGAMVAEAIENIREQEIRDRERRRREREQHYHRTRRKSDATTATAAASHTSAASGASTSTRRVTFSPVLVTQPAPGFASLRAYHSGLGTPPQQVPGTYSSMLPATAAVPRDMAGPSSKVTFRDYPSLIEVSSASSSKGNFGAPSTVYERVPSWRNDLPPPSSSSTLRPPPTPGDLRSPENKPLPSIPIPDNVPDSPSSSQTIMPIPEPIPPPYRERMSDGHRSDIADPIHSDDDKPALFIRIPQQSQPTTTQIAGDTPTEPQRSVPRVHYNLPPLERSTTPTPTILHLPPIDPIDEPEPFNEPATPPPPLTPEDAVMEPVHFESHKIHTTGVAITLPVPPGPDEPSVSLPLPPVLLDHPERSLHDSIISVESGESMVSSVGREALLKRAELYRNQAWAEEHERKELLGKQKAAKKARNIREAFLLSLDAKKASEKVQTLHNKAARRYYLAHNSQDPTVRSVDVHGLLVAEAIEKTEDAVCNAILKGHSLIKVIVGKGLHSKNNKAVLKPALTKAMQSQGITTKVDPNNAGVLILSWSNSDLANAGS